MIQFLIVVLLLLAIASIVLEIFIALLPIILIGGLVLYFMRKNNTRY